MPIAVEMPKMTDTMEEGVLVQWSVEEGASIAAGDIIAQVETDKATMDVEAYDDGVLLRKVAQEGEVLAIGGLIAVLGDEGEDVDAFLNSRNDTPAAAPEAGVPAVTPVFEMTSAPVTSEDGRRLKASPLARRMAADHGLQLELLTGSGPEGRIIKRDIIAELDRPRAVPAPAAIPHRAYKSIRITQMRKAIARRLAESKYSAPHFYLTAEVAMERAVEARIRLNAQADNSGGNKISFNDLVTKACAVALMQHPAVNRSYLADHNEIREYGYVDIGVAVAIDEGLVTPVIRDADKKGLADIAQETVALAARARDRTLTPEEMEGSTFTTSNLGMFGIEEFTAIINPPNACILAIGAIRDVPVVKDDAVVPGKRMTITLSCDHRVVDGATGARFMSTLRSLLEEPLLLFM